MKKGQEYTGTVMEVKFPNKGVVCVDGEDDETCIVKNVCYLFCNAELDKIGVGAQQSFLEASVLSLVSDSGDSACAVIRCFVENKTISHRILPFLSLCVVI